MADKITRNYKLTASGLLNVTDDGNIYISVEDGPQDVNLAGLLADFNGKSVKFNCSFDNDITAEETVDIDIDTGEVK